MNHSTLSTLLDVFVDVGAHALVVGVGIMWGRRALRRYATDQNDQ